MAGIWRRPGPLEGCPSVWLWLFHFQPSLSGDKAFDNYKSGKAHMVLFFCVLFTVKYTSPHHQVGISYFLHTDMML